MCFFFCFFALLPTPRISLATLVRRSRFKLFGFSISLVACVAQGKQETKKMVAVSWREGQPKNCSGAYRLHCGIGIGAKALPISSNQSGPYSVCIVKLPTAAPLSLLSLVLLVRCAILRVCPRVVPEEHGGRPLLSMGRVSPVRCRIAESGRKAKTAHRYIVCARTELRSHSQMQSRQLFSSHPRSSHPSWHLILSVTARL